LAIDPKHHRKILIVQKLDYRGRSKFILKHKKSRWKISNHKDIPKEHRIHRTLEDAEKSAIFLLENYNYFFN